MNVFSTGSSRMGRRGTFRLMAVCLALAVVTPLSSAALNGDQQWLAPEYWHNGHRLGIRRIDSPASVDDLLLQIERQWYAGADETQTDGGLPVVVRDRYAEWSIMSVMQGHRLRVVQLRPAGSGSTGYYSERDLTQPHAQPGRSGRLLPLGAEVVSTSHSRDGAQAAETTIALLRGGLDQIWQPYRARLLNSGWRLLHESEQPTAVLALLNRGTDRLDLTLIEDDSDTTFVVVNTSSRSP